MKDLFVSMMPEADIVIVISKRDDPLGVLLGHGEQVLEDVCRPLAEIRLEIVEHEVGVLLAHGRHLRHVVPHYHIRHLEECSRPVREVADYLEFNNA